MLNLQLLKSVTSWTYRNQKQLLRLRTWLNAIHYRITKNDLIRREFTQLPGKANKHVLCLPHTEVNIIPKPIFNNQRSLNKLVSKFYNLHNRQILPFISLINPRIIILARNDDITFIIIVMLIIDYTIIIQFILIIIIIIIIAISIIISTTL